MRDPKKTKGLHAGTLKIECKVVRCGEIVQVFGVSPPPGIQTLGRVDGMKT